MEREQVLQTTSGPVRLKGRLGSGAMGTVHQGWHEKLNCAVAVKFLTAHTATSHERFLREGKNGGRINHPHVVHMLDSGDDHGQAYLILEFVDGRSLGELLEHQETVDRETPPTDRPLGALPDCSLVARIAAQVAQGLEAIHATGVVHRDIKPENLMLATNGQVKISDLGLAKQVRDPETLVLTGANMVVGTPLYVSPEGIRHPQAITGAADIYGLGATLYHLVAGRPPFPGTSPFEVMRGHLDQVPAPLKSIRPDIPTPLANAIERCLAKDPTARPTPANLQKLLRGERVAVARARPRLLAICLAVAVVVAVCAVSLWLVLR